MDSNELFTAGEEKPWLKAPGSNELMEGTSRNRTESSRSDIEQCCTQWNFLRNQCRFFHWATLRNHQGRWKMDQVDRVDWVIDVRLRLAALYFRVGIATRSLLSNTTTALRLWSISALRLCVPLLVHGEDGAVDEMWWESKQKNRWGRSWGWKACAKALGSWFPLSPWLDMSSFFLAVVSCRERKKVLAV